MKYYHKTSVKLNVW